MKAIIEVIVKARAQLRHEIATKDNKTYWKGVSRILNNYNFMLLLADEMIKSKCSANEAIVNISKLDAIILHGKKSFSEDDMIEIKGALKYLSEFIRTQNCT